MYIDECTYTPCVCACVCSCVVLSNAERISVRQPNPGCPTRYVSVMLRNVELFRLGM